MNPSDIKDFDVDSSEDKKCDSVHIPKMAPKKKKRISMAATAVLIFVIMAIYSYETEDAILSGSRFRFVLGFIRVVIDENRIKLLYPIFFMSPMIIAIFLFGVNDWSSSLLKISKRIIIGLAISVTSVVTGVVICVLVTNHKENIRKSAETLVKIGEPLKAEQVLKNYIIRYPDDPHGMVDLGVVYWNNGKRDKSLVVFQEFGNNFNLQRTFEIGCYFEKKVAHITYAESSRLKSNIVKLAMFPEFQEDTKRLEMLCRIRPLLGIDEIQGISIEGYKWINENSFERLRGSFVLDTFASWLRTKNNKDAIESAFQLDHEVETLGVFGNTVDIWERACSNNNMLDAAREASQLRSDISERYHIELKNSEKKGEGRGPGPE